MFTRNNRELAWVDRIRTACGTCAGAEVAEARRAVQHLQLTTSWGWASDLDSPEVVPVLLDEYDTLDGAVARFAADLDAIDVGEALVPSFKVHDLQLDGLSAAELPETTMPNQAQDTPGLRSNRVAATDPIDTFSGALYRTDRDVSLITPGGAWHLERTHNSRCDLHGRFGLGWSSLLDACIRRLRDRAVVRTPEGSRIAWRRNAAGTWVGPDKARAVLVTLGGFNADVTGRLFAALDGVDGLDGLDLDRASMAMVLPDGGLHLADHNGWIVATIDGTGHGLIVQRDDDGTPRSVATTTGRRVAITTDDGQVTALEGPDGRHVYRHDRGRLVEVTHPDRTVSYEHDDRGNLTQVWRDGVLLVHSEFDASGRVVDQVDATGGRWHFDYAIKADFTRSTTTVTRPDGSRRTISYRRDGRVAADSSPAGTIRWMRDATGQPTEVMTPTGARRVELVDDDRVEQRTHHRRDFVRPGSPHRRRCRSTDHVRVTQSIRAGQPWGDAVGVAPVNGRRHR